MEKVIKNSVFNNLSFPENSVIKEINNILTVTKWNWDFLECLKFQKEAQEFVRKNRDLKVYIFCNHPHCFTLGRGNERGQNDLVDFNESEASKLGLPVHKIHRGGGITFHFPGQWIFYPICSINTNYSLEDHMCWLLKSVKLNLENTFKIEKLMATKKLMGIWHGRSKLASIGVGVNRFVTEHGLALNMTFDKKMETQLNLINPCGINPETYTSVSKVLKSSSEGGLKEEFHTNYLENLAPKLK